MGAATMGQGPIFETLAHGDHTMARAAVSAITPLKYAIGCAGAGLLVADLMGRAVPHMESATRWEKRDTSLMKQLVQPAFDKIATKQQGVIDRQAALAAGIDGDRFEQMDLDKNGVISYEEFVQGIQNNVLEGVQVKWGPAEQVRQANIRGIDAVGVRHAANPRGTTL